MVSFIYCLHIYYCFINDIIIESSQEALLEPEHCFVFFSAELGCVVRSCHDVVTVTLGSIHSLTQPSLSVSYSQNVTQLYTHSYICTYMHTSCSQIENRNMSTFVQSDTAFITVQQNRYYADHVFVILLGAWTFTYVNFFDDMLYTCVCSCTQNLWTLSVSRTTMSGD